MEPLGTDILCARGGAALHHPGTQVYRNLVAKNKVDYCMAADKDKIRISRSIVMTLREQNRRFLAKAKDGTWYILDEKKAVEKTSQALREGQPELKKHLFSNSGVVPGDAVTAVADVSAPDAIVAPVLVAPDFQAPAGNRKKSRSPIGNTKQKAPPARVQGVTAASREEFNVFYPPLPLNIADNGNVNIAAATPSDPTAGVKLMQYPINVESYGQKNDSNGNDNDNDNININNAEELTHHPIDSFNMGISGLSLLSCTSPDDIISPELRNATGVIDPSFPHTMAPQLYNPHHHQHDQQQAQYQNEYGMIPPQEYSSNDAMDNFYHNQYQYQQQHQHQQQAYQTQYQVHDNPHIQIDIHYLPEGGVGGGGQIQDLSQYNYPPQVIPHPTLSSGLPANQQVQQDHLEVHDELTEEARILRKLDRELAHGPSSLSILSNVSDLHMDSAIIDSTSSNGGDGIPLSGTRNDVEQAMNPQGNINQSTRSDIMSVDSVNQEFSCMSLNIGISSGNLEATIKSSQDLIVDTASKRSQNKTDAAHSGSEREMVSQISHVNVINESLMSFVSMQSFDVSLNSVNSMAPTSTYNISSPTASSNRITIGADGIARSNYHEYENTGHLRQTFAAMKKRNRRPQKSDVDLVNEEEEYEQEKDQQQQQEFNQNEQLPPTTPPTDFGRRESTNTVGSFAATSMGSWDSTELAFVPSTILDEENGNYHDFDSNAKLEVSGSFQTHGRMDQINQEAEEVLPERALVRSMGTRF